MIDRMARRIVLPFLMMAVVALVPPAPLGGQTPPRSLTLADVLRLVRERHPALAAASAHRLTVAASARQEAAYGNPIVEWRREDIGAPLVGDAFLTVTQPLDVTGRRAALRAGADATDRRARADSATVARALELEAARAFWRASLARSLHALAAEQRVDAERLATTEAARAQEGAIAESWAMRASLEAERARLTEAASEAEWVRARAELARALALPPDSLPPVAALEPIDTLRADAPTLDAALAHANDRRSELAAARAARDAARSRESAARRGVLGDLSLQAGTKRSAGLTTRVVGVLVPVPLLDRNASGRAAATGELRRATAAMRAAELAVHADVAGAVEGYRALLSARATGAPALAARAAEIARIADAAYAAGGASLVELLDARRARGETLAALLRWIAAVRLAEIDIAHATGAPVMNSVENP